MSDLFDWSEEQSPQRKSRADQIFAAFEKFHTANPKVWTLFKRFALQASNRDRKHYSANAIFERIRWHIEIETEGGDLKLNNNFRAYYARMFHLAHPNLDGFFRNRKLNSEDRVAPETDRQVFVDEPAGEEKEITSRLKSLLDSTDP